MTRQPVNATAHEPSLAPGELRAAARYALGVRRFLARPLSSAAARRLVGDERRRADEAFLAALGRAVFTNPGGPYRRLFERARLDHDDVAAMVHTDGLERALDRLYEQGVYLTLDEFKGRAPILRDGLELQASPEQFDNPRVSAAFRGATGGSSGSPRRLSVDLAGLESEGAYYRLMLEAFGVQGLPTALWRPVPPGVTGLKAVLRAGKAGHPVQRWFSTGAFVPGLGGARGRAIVIVTLAGARLAGLPAPRPQYVAASDPLPIVAWLSAALTRGPGAIVHCTPSSAARICDRAEEARVSIAGAFFRLGGEPFTEARHRQLSRAGVRGAPLYSMTEVGNIGVPCPHGDLADAVHVLEGKLAVRPRRQRLASGEHVDALHLTTLTSSTSKFMVNVESGDAAKSWRAPCGCSFGALGYEQRLGEISSYEKLTLEGMTFLTSDVLRVVEEALPARFGGLSTDYQLRRVATSGRPDRLAVNVSPRLGSVDERAVVDCVLAELGRGSRANEMMAEVWRAAGTVRVLRQSPKVTATGKTPALLIG